MDTDVFDTEISLTKVTNVFIELPSSRIHRNMISRPECFRSKSILALNTVAAITTLTYGQMAQATYSNPDEPYCDQVDKTAYKLLGPKRCERRWNIPV